MFVIKRDLNIENGDISAYHKIVERIFLDGEKEKKFSKILGINKPRLKKLVFKLSINGWYLDDWTEVDGRTIKFLQNHLDGGSLIKINDYFIQHYEQRLGSIKERLGERYPKRRDLLQEGFEAIEGKRYSSATLIFLTQIDGISYDTTQKFYFTSLNKGKKFVPQIEPHIIENLSEVVDFLLAPITNKTAINAHKSEIDNFNSPLNRHEIIHGVNADFGTKENALKVVSFISFLDNILNELYH